MKGSAGCEREAADTELLCLWHVLAAHLLQPARCLLSALKTELSGPQNLFNRHFSSLNGDDFRLRIKRFQHCCEALQDTTRNHIRFTDEDNVSEFHLLNQQIGNAPLVLLAEMFTGFLKRLGLVIIDQKVHGIDHGNHGV